RQHPARHGRRRGHPGYPAGSRYRRTRGSGRGTMSSQAQPKALQQTPIAGWSAVRLLRVTPVGLLLPLAIIALLELRVSRGWVPAWLMPAPSDLLMTFRELAGVPRWSHTSASTDMVLPAFS